MSTPPPPSILPTERIISAWGAVALSLMASLTELAIIGATTYEHAHGRLSTELWIGAVLVPALGPLMGRARGKIPGASIAVVGSAVTTVLETVRHWR